MKSSDSNSENSNKSEDSSLDKLLNKNRSDRKDDLPAEEFISPDPTRSVPEKDEEVEEVDKMGISKKAKNQPSDERDISKNKK